MKIIYILPYDWGGMPHYTSELANAVSNYADVMVIGTVDIKQEYFNKKIKILKLFNSPTFSMDHLEDILSLETISWFFSFKNLSVINKYNPDMIHLTTPIIPPLYIFLFLCRLYKRYPIIYTKHGIISGSGLKIKIFEEILVGIFERIIIFNKIIVHTKNDKEVLIKLKKVPLEKITVISHGAYSFFKSLTAATYKQERNCILFFGNILEYKGLKYLLMAVPLIEKEISDFKIIIAGKGDTSQYSGLIDKCDKSRFEMHNEFIPDEKVAELFQRADLVVLPYTQMSGQSGILNIAATFGRPIVATNVGGFNEVIENGITGYLVPPKNPEKLAGAIISILKDDNLKGKMSTMMKSKAEELSWDNIAKKHICIYNTILKETKKIE